MSLWMVRSKVLHHVFSIYKGLGHWSAHENAKFRLEASDDDQHCLLSNVSLQMNESEVSNCHHSQLLEMTETREFDKIDLKSVA